MVSYHHRSFQVREPLPRHRGWAVWKSSTFLGSRWKGGGPGGWLTRRTAMAMDQAVDPSLKYLHSKSVAKQCVGLGPTNIDESRWQENLMLKVFWFICLLIDIDLQYPDISWYIQISPVSVDYLNLRFLVILSHPFVARCCKSWLYMNWWLSNDLVRQFWQCQILLFRQLCLFVNYVLTRPFTMHYVTLCINMHFFTGFCLKRSSCLLSAAQTATHPWFIGLCLNL